MVVLYYAGHDHEVLASCGWLKQDAGERVASHNGRLQAIDHNCGTWELKFACGTAWKETVRVRRANLRGGLSCVVCCVVGREQLPRNKGGIVHSN